MKKSRKILRLFSFITLFALAAGLSSCSVRMRPQKTVPPGQVKKITGEQSARRYAPGQYK